MKEVLRVDNLGGVLFVENLQIATARIQEFHFAL
jgi:hypothetical protein